jgi:hypothetical protein
MKLPPPSGWLGHIGKIKFVHAFIRKLFGRRLARDPDNVSLTFEDSSISFQWPPKPRHTQFPMAGLAWVARSIPDYARSSGARPRPGDIGHVVTLE